MITNVIDALKKYWPDCRLRYDMLDLMMTTFHFKMLLGRMIKHGATREEIDNVIADWDQTYAY